MNWRGNNYNRDWMKAINRAFISGITVGLSLALLLIVVFYGVTR